MRIGIIARLAVAGAVALATVPAVGSPAAAAPAPRATAGTMTSAVDGTFGNGGTVTGTFTPQRFAARNGRVVAVGTLHSVLTDAAGSPVGAADTPVTLPVQLPAGGLGTLAACPILHLVLGPLDLNLLGLTVHLNTVVLDITANSGPGNLLGNLLCAIAGLLNGGLNAPVAQIVALLNAILALLTV
ncbi:hypothetical protein GCM10020358_61870 [Amorphoplanes nipponensis]|uniref:Secreted protein n=1 Tax=Actinoplanes nipponensis TaxID=135950 RepID=A0A919MLI5_9ACTN|nr:hypothetical protein [Actinoplanes nipponensis]GIE53989.1 hypothetical protein Ani05nite_75230 [Actinoplanes nipponensis]